MSLWRSLTKTINGMTNQIIDLDGTRFIYPKMLELFIWMAIKHFDGHCSFCRGTQFLLWTLIGANRKDFPMWWRFEEISSVKLLKLITKFRICSILAQRTTADRVSMQNYVILLCVLCYPNVEFGNKNKIVILVVVGGIWSYFWGRDWGKSHPYRNHKIILKFYVYHIFPIYSV